MMSGVNAARMKNASECKIIRFISRTVSTGYCPIAVSPDNITASTPRLTAVATSLASALVGCGLEIILSSICVAMITGRL